jgi:hypothetical protein
LFNALLQNPFPAAGLPAGTTVAHITQGSRSPSNGGAVGNFFVNLSPQATSSGEVILFEVDVYDPGSTAPTPYGNMSPPGVTIPVSPPTVGSNCFGDVLAQPEIGFFCGWQDRNVFGICSGSAYSSDIQTYCSALYGDLQTDIRQVDPGGGL